MMYAGTANIYMIYRKTIKTKRKTIKLILFNDKSGSSVYEYLRIGITTKKKGTIATLFQGNGSEP